MLNSMEQRLSGVFSAFNSELYLEGSFEKDQFKGEVLLDDTAISNFGLQAIALGHIA